VSRNIACCSYGLPLHERVNVKKCEFLSTAPLRISARLSNKKTASYEVTDPLSLENEQGDYSLDTQ
jgi:hypothetical protein